MNKKTTLSTMCACVGEENEIWIFSNEFNGLFKIDLGNMSLKYITSFEKEEMDISYAYSAAIWYKKRIYFFPLSANAIAIYDTMTGVVSYMEIPEKKKNFNVIQISDREVLLFPVFYSDSAFVFDLEVGRCKRIHLEYGENRNIVMDAMMYGNAFYDEKAYFAVENKPYFVCVDLRNEKIRVIDSHNGKRVFHIVSSENHLIVLAADGCSYDVYIDETFLKSNSLKSDNNLKKYSPKDMGYVQNKVIFEGSILSVPVFGEDICVYKDGEKKYLSLEWDKIVESEQRVQAFAVCLEKNNTVYFLPYEGKALVSFDFINKRMQYFTMEIAEEDRSLICSKVIQKGCSVFEKEWLSVEELVKSII